MSRAKLVISDHVDKIVTVKRLVETDTGVWREDSEPDEGEQDIKCSLLFDFGKHKEVRDRFFAFITKNTIELAQPDEDPDVTVNLEQGRAEVDRQTDINNAGRDMYYRPNARVVKKVAKAKGKFGRQHKAYRKEEHDRLTKQHLEQFNRREDMRKRVEPMEYRERRFRDKDDVERMEESKNEHQAVKRGNFKPKYGRGGKR